MQKEDLIELLKLLTNLFDKYNLKEIKCISKEMHPFKNNRIITKEMYHLTIKDMHGFKLDDTTYDTKN